MATPTPEACVTDWSFSFRCSPPRVATTQLRFDTARLFAAQERTSTALSSRHLRRTRAPLGGGSHGFNVGTSQAICLHPRLPDFLPLPAGEFWREAQKARVSLQKPQNVRVTAKKFYDWQTVGGTDDVMRLVDCLKRADIPWCAIGDVAVNHWATEPMVTQPWRTAVLILV